MQAAATEGYSERGGRIERWRCFRGANGIVEIDETMFGRRKKSVDARMHGHTDRKLILG
jgi:hypothetical protein